jgi:hypothetical protein
MHRQSEHICPDAEDGQQTIPPATLKEKKVGHSIRLIPASRAAIAHSSPLPLWPIRDFEGSLAGPRAFRRPSLSKDGRDTMNRSFPRSPQEAPEACSPHGTSCMAQAPIRDCPMLHPPSSRVVVVRRSHIRQFCGSDCRRGLCLSLLPWRLTLRAIGGDTVAGCWRHDHSSSPKALSLGVLRRGA